MSSESFYRIKPTMPATKRPTYMEGLDYIARNDEPLMTDLDGISGLPSVHLLAALFGMHAAYVARDVARIRALIEKESAAQ